MRRRLLLPGLALLIQGAYAFLPPGAVHPRSRQTFLPSVAPGTENVGTSSDEGCRTYKILRELQRTDQGSGGAGASIDVEGLKRMDAAWAAVRNMQPGTGSAPQFVEETDVPLPTAPEFDVLVAGGTLGIFVATCLQLKGFKVAVVERGVVAGRTQEWNVSLKELQEFVKLGVFTEEELKDIIGIQFNPIRVGFMGERGPYEFLTEDVLNLGVYPSVLIAKARARFEAAGGVVMERTAVEGALVAPNGVKLKGPELTGRLLIDCMGNGSPITRQVRYGQRPDGVCIVVGTMASGFAPENNTMADLLYTNVPTMDKGARSGVQYFWEAFPASTAPGDRTTYLFHYTDTHPERLSITECFEDYWELLPSYQGIDSIEQLTFRRAVCNFFPTYKDSPLPTRFDRVCQIGDASGIQSPLSFGGFASLTRHLPRLSQAFTEALEADCLTKADLGLINAYTPNLSVTWMFQRSMSVPVGSRPHPYLINRGLINTFRAMEQLGEPVLKPFLQDVVQAVPLARALAGTLKEDPLNLPNILLHVGPDAFFSWFGHYSALVLYTILHELLKETKNTQLLGGRLRYQWNRLLELFEYGSGMDYVLD